MISKIIIISFGQIEREIIDKAISALKKQFKVEIEFFQELPIPWFAERNGQMKAVDFLVYEREILENNGAEAILGITKKDLFMPNFQFVFGLANPLEKTAIVSLNRLFDLNRQSYFKRIQKEVIHEIGHLFNLGHCHNFQCVMSFSNNIKEVDKKSMALCANCERIINAGRISKKATI